MKRDTFSYNIVRYKGKVSCNAYWFFKIFRCKFRWLTLIHIHKCSMVDSNLNLLTIAIQQEIGISEKTNLPIMEDKFQFGLL